MTCEGLLKEPLNGGYVDPSGEVPVMDRLLGGKTPDTVPDEDIPVGPGTEAVELVTGNGGSKDDVPGVVTKLPDGVTDDRVDSTVVGPVDMIEGSEEDPPVGPLPVIDEFVNGNGAVSDATEVIRDKLPETELVPTVGF